MNLGIPWKFQLFQLTIYKMKQSSIKEEFRKVLLEKRTENGRTTSLEGYPQAVFQDLESYSTFRKILEEDIQLIFKNM